MGKNDVMIFGLNQIIIIFQDMDIIDIGCGIGNFLEYFFRFELRNLVLMDVSEGMFSKVKEKLQFVFFFIYLLFKYVVLLNMLYEDNFFDVVMMNLV